MEDMLTSNGYPEETIRRACRRMPPTQSLRPRPHRRSPPEGVLTLPYISEPILHQVRRAVARSGLNLRIAQTSGQTLRSILTRSALEKPPCPGRRDCPACLAGLQGGRCATKNVVYRLKCTLCSECYIGETKRPLRERLMEHRRAARSRDIKNPWGAHFATAHRDSPTPNMPFTAEIVNRAKDHVDRKITEAITIAEEKPTINTDRGWQLLPTIRGRFM